ncbi:FAD:protein FMN transferase [Pusillimonas sp. CC-YST705]|uniref:FAD:protein FMN transferase n=1 Tax=Mesopusillimonas faecipullorum TaxID=2755040 RepID=A0ABS8C9N2_9BURK|nr:FAD:protein FMN transferase [Mesopusillimonas faecipullorum]MCB5362756.1 FAD:protein FMN transferase [Mesopusillimonas faecipullorum]
MGTTWSVQVAGPWQDARLAQAGQPLPGQASTELTQALQAKLDDIIDQMSHWEADSLISRINKAPTGWYQVPEEFFTVVSCAQQVAQATQGAYDPTVGELVALWGFGPHGQPGQLPCDSQLEDARQRSGWQQLHLNAEHRGVWQPGGMSLDFSSIAKGYGVDAMALALEDYGLTNYMVELGGELRAKGRNPSGQPWRLQVEAPGAHHEQAGLPIALDGLSIATSGDYRRFFIVEGQRYAHTLDPRTGRALQNNLACVSVVHSQCMMADALSTALLCMGLENGMAYASKQHLAALFMVRHGEDIAVEWTPSFQRLAHPA